MHLTPALAEIAENRLLDGWARVFTRRPDQLNGAHGADAELVPLPCGELLLAITVDTIEEEIEMGFYRDPETIGWMAVTVSLSDLAAVGADPLGLLISVTLPGDATAGFREGLARGVEAACRAAGTYILGGDTNVGHRTSVSSVGAGIVPRARVQLRTGCGTGDLLYATGPLGAGGAVAARSLFPLADGRPPLAFRPRSRLREGRALAGFATACMDSSDGLVSTLDQLLRLNGVGFELTTPLDQLLDPEALLLARVMGADPLLMLAQPHGEFELVFTIPGREQDRFLAHAAAEGWEPLFLGRVIPEPVLLVAGPVPRVVDGARIRNLLHDVGGDLGRYLTELTRLVAGP
jgi:thiamine-monophosphate kinase